MDGPFCYRVLAVTACFTCLIAGSCATLEPDLKKVVAFSTLSQLGVMGLAISFRLPELAFFHLVIHALFKALIFICVGCVILIRFGVQESRYFSGLYYKMPVIRMWLVVSCLSLRGFPFFAGCFSKDLLLEGVLSRGLRGVGVALVYGTCFFTAVYSLRVVSLIFSGDGGQPCRLYKETRHYYFSTLVLGVGRVVGGILFQSLFVDYNIHCRVRALSKLRIFLSVGIGAFTYLLFHLKKIPMTGPINFLVEFVIRMFFLKGLRGSMLSYEFLKRSYRVEAMETNVEMFLGEGLPKEGYRRLLGGVGVPFH